MLGDEHDIFLLFDDYGFNFASQTNTLCLLPKYTSAGIRLLRD